MVSSEHHRDVTGTKRSTKNPRQAKRETSDEGKVEQAQSIINPLLTLLGGITMALVAEGVFGLILGVVVAIGSLALLVKRLS